MSSWRERAACRGSSIDFFAEDDVDQTAAAMAVCRSCPVADPCLEHARRVPWGVWGGRTPEERRGAT